MFYGILRAFDEAVRVGSIRKASDALGVAPSSISRNIALLERQMGTTLLTRRKNGVEPTYAGRLVAEYARTVLLEYDALRADLDDTQGMRRKLLRLAVVESVSSYGHMRSVSKYAEHFPSICFNIRLVPAPGVVAAVLAGDCDIGIGYSVQPDSQIRILASIPEPIVLVVRKDDPLVRSKSVDLKILPSLRLGLPDVDFGVRQILDRACGKAGLELSPVLTSNVFETLRDFVRCGAGAAILPRRAVSRADHAKDLKFIAIEGDAFSKGSVDVIVLRKRRLTRAIRGFVELLIGELKSRD